MRDGYAIVASDYVGLGTPGLHAYLHGRSEAHSIVDMVKAGRAFTRAELPRRQRLARDWVVIGQSQGGGAAIYAARYATETGGRYLDLAETACVFAFEEALAGVNVGGFFTRPVASLPGFSATVRGYMAMPEAGFDRPFFMGHGTLDLDVPYPTTALYAARLEANGEPVTFRTYLSDHSGTLLGSQRDTHPFVRVLFE
jgi:hypothetical protein